MPMSQNDIQGMGATRIIVGLSQVIRFSPGPFQYANTLKYVSGGSFELVLPQFSGSSTASGATAWGTGYVLGANEIFNISGPATFYVCATGATSIAALSIGYTSGASLL